MSDWYGISLLRASILIRSKRISGRRSEMVFVEGFKWGQAAGSALLQSRYALESCASQNCLYPSLDLLPYGHIGRAPFL